MNGVDRKDRDTADWTVSLKSPRFYLRIFYWTLDGVIHAMFCVMKDFVTKNKKDPWKKHYDDKEWGRYWFQMDMGIALINHGLSLDWKYPKKDPRPPYVRSEHWDWVPRDCHKAKHQLPCSSAAMDSPMPLPTTHLARRTHHQNQRNNVLEIE